MSEYPDDYDDGTLFRSGGSCNTSVAMVGLIAAIVFCVCLVNSAPKAEQQQPTLATQAEEEEIEDPNEKPAAAVNRIIEDLGTKRSRELNLDPPEVVRARVKEGVE